MCRRVVCKRCQRPTWSGCGAHVEQVLGDVPKSERCRCRELAKASAPAGGKAEKAEKGWLARLLGG